MAVSATPVAAPRSASTSTKIPSRPTTPLRSISRSSFRQSKPSPSRSPAGDEALGAASGTKTFVVNDDDFPLSVLEPAFAELSDSMADLEANFMHLQLLNESVARFNENFAAFLYGLNMTAFCVDFPEAPILQSFNRHGSNTCQLEQSPYRHNRFEPAEDDHGHAHDATFLTTDTSFVVNPPSNTAVSRTTAARGSMRGRPATATARGRGRGGPVVAGTDASGKRTTRLPSGQTRGTARGVARGRGSVR